MGTRRGRGEGAIFQRHDHKTCPPVTAGERPAHRCRGKWVAVIDYGWKGGRRDRRNIYGATKTEVQTKLKETLKEAPRDRPSDMPTVAEWLDKWIAEYKPLLRDQTRTSHTSKINQYMKPLIGSTRLDRLTTLQVEQIEARMTMPCPDPSPAGKCAHRPRHGLAIATARQTFVILRDALGDAVKAEKISRNPADTADPPGTYQAQREHLTTPLADLVLKVAESRGELARWTCALEQGLRQGEALGLIWGLLDLDAGTVSIERTLEQNGAIGKPKSEASRRKIPLTTNTWAALRAHRARLEAAGITIEPTTRVFGGTSDNDRKSWARLLEAASLPHVALHSARQSAARRLEEEGVPERVAAEFLGHSNVNQTYKYQRGAGIDALRKAISG